MRKMKLAPLMGIHEDKVGLQFIVLAVAVLLVGSLVVPSFIGVAEEREKGADAPVWMEGDTWRYGDQIPMPGEDGELGYVETEIEMEVIDEKARVNIHVEGEGTETYDTYVVRETQNPDGDDPWIVDYHYAKDNLAEIHNDPLKGAESGYHPPIVELDFPLYEGKEWNGTANFFRDVDEDGFSDPDREYWYMGKVEDRVNKEMEGFGVKDAYMVNLTVAGYDLEDDESILHRYEIYYSPEVKNVIHTDIFETRVVDFGGIGNGDDLPVSEESVGNKTLLDYNVEPYDSYQENGEEGEVSLLGIGFVLLIIGVGTASVYIYKKVKSSL